jgi:predicted unusual protein kinase regulating ubiquinone biosynthesis (AarF/ABC1/UbiB family)
LPAALVRNTLAAMSSDDPKRPVSKGRRFLKLAGMTASVTANYAGARLKGVFQDATDAARARADAHQFSGEKIADTLGELKGAAMKIGQMASVAGDVLPRELSTALRKLQKEAPPVEYEVIAEQIEAELGSPPELLFERFDREPFASASIGQVHRARTDDGREVVVKVQYPGVDRSVDSDLFQLKIALKASGLVQMSRKSLNELFHEIRARLREELDYCNEADNVRDFRKFHADHSFVIVPEVVGERSAQRVLTLSYEAGDSINDLHTLGYSREVIDTIGANLFELTLSQLFEFQRLHADPNPANFAFRPNGDIVLYDFGCVKRCKPEIIRWYRETILAAIDENWDRVDQGMIELGARRPAGPRPEDAYYKVWRDLLLLPFLGDAPFDYGDSTIHDDLKKLIPGVLRRLDSFQPPVELIFIDRVIAGHYGNMRTLRARGHFLDIVMRYLHESKARE